MDWRVSRVNQEVKKLDRRLFANRRPNGAIQVLRQAERIEASNFHMVAPDLASLHPQFVIALTDNWNLTGQPVDWGLEPIIQQLKSMDLWNDDKMLDRLRLKREREAEDQERAMSNELRARALDMRKDFARATNDINTSALK